MKEIPFFFSFLTLQIKVIYQNALMHKSELRVNLTLITRANKVYELKAGATGTHRNTGSLIIQIMKLIQHPTIENQLNSNILCK